MEQGFTSHLDPSSVDMIATNPCQLVWLIHVAKVDEARKLQCLVFNLMRLDVLRLCILRD